MAKTSTIAPGRSRTGPLTEAEKQQFIRLEITGLLTKMATLSDAAFATLPRDMQQWYNQGVAELFQR